MSAEPREVLVTADVAKLPALWADAIDVTKPLPSGVTFFERKIVAGDFLWAIGAGCVCALLGVICFPLGWYMLWTNSGDRYNSGSSDWWVIGFGFTTLFAAWMCATSLLSNWRTMRQQDQGQPTRLGLFLYTDELLVASEHAYTIIPRDRFAGIAGHDVKYTAKDLTKTTRLPTTLIRDEPRAMIAAIEAWARALEPAAAITSLSRFPK